MLRLLVPFLGVALVVLIAVIVVGMMRSIDRRDRRARRRMERQEALADYQQRKAIEDLERHRARIEGGIDAMYEDRGRVLGETPEA
jgi:hypothetical protein